MADAHLEHIARDLENVGIKPVFPQLEPRPQEKQWLTFWQMLFLSCGVGVLLWAGIIAFVLMVVIPFAKAAGDWFSQHIY